jgi:hypothetical protein
MSRWVGRREPGAQRRRRIDATPILLRHVGWLMRRARKRRAAVDILDFITLLFIEKFTSLEV